jgi:hypothetical protein
MGLRDRLDRARREAGEHFATAVCPECGETFRYAGDLALDIVVAQWVRVTQLRSEYEVDPTVARVLDHPHEELVGEALRDLPAFRHAR